MAEVCALPNGLSLLTMSALDHHFHIDQAAMDIMPGLEFSILNISRLGKIVTHQNGP